MQIGRTTRDIDVGSGHASKLPHINEDRAMVSAFFTLKK